VNTYRLTQKKGIPIDWPKKKSPLSRPQAAQTCDDHNFYSR